MAPPRSNQAIAIVGAGPGGLCLALVLRHLGFTEVAVFERESALSSSTHMLELTANASRILHALGLQPELSRGAIQPDFSYIRTAHRGFVLTQRALGGFSSARYGAPVYLMKHNELVTLLATECQRKNVSLTTDRPVTDVTPDTGTAHFADGETAIFAAIVAADGAGSVLRAVMAPEPTSENTDRNGTGIRVVTASAPVAPTTNAIQTFTTSHGYITLYPAGPEHTELLAVSEVRSNPDADPLTSVMTLSGVTCGELSRVLPHLDNVVEQPNIDIEPALHWHAGKLALLGDACHPLPSFSAQGACAAIEDAWVLGTMMERWEESPAQGFADYQRYRLPRVRKLRARAKETAAELMMADPGQTLRRNLKWSLTGRFLPEVAMARSDWLYGYDCIRGFA